VMTMPISSIRVPSVDNAAGSSAAPFWSLTGVSSGSRDLSIRRLRQPSRVGARTVGGNH
jgi:hypothetical protein